MSDKFLLAELKTLREEKKRLLTENAMLKRVVGDVSYGWKVPKDLDLSLTAEEEAAFKALEPSWTDRVDFFKQMAREVLEVAVELCRVQKKPVHQDEVARVWINSHIVKAHSMKDPEGTVKARIRDLRREGFFQPSPTVPEGYVFPTPKAAGEEGEKQ